MSRKVLLVVVGIVVLGCEWVSAKTVVCTMASLERTVELHHENPGKPVPCEVRYAKPTEGWGEQVLWRAEHEVGYCAARFTELMDRLEGFGWSCAPAAEATDTRPDTGAGEPEPAAAPEASADEPEATAAAEEGSEPEAADTSEAPTTE